MLWSCFICFTLLCVMCGEAASIFSVVFFLFFHWSFTRKKTNSFCNQTEWLSWMRAVVSVLWRMTIDCYLWGLDRNSGGGGDYKDASITFSCDGDVERVVGRLDSSCLSHGGYQVHWTVWEGGDEHVWWSLCTRLWMSYFTCKIQ